MQEIEGRRDRVLLPRIWISGLLLGFLATIFLISSPAAAMPPSVTLTSPVGAPGGDVWTGGSVHDILWSVLDIDTPSVSYWINYSLNNGGSWTNLDNGTVIANNATRSLPWTVPSADTIGARVRVCAVDNASVDCADSGMFEVDSTAPTASPSPGDGTLSVALNSPIEITFGEPMRVVPAPAVSNVLFVPPVNVTLLIWANSTRLLVGHGDFTSGTAYAWYISCSIRDDSDPGNPVAGCGASLWTFTTAPMPNAPPSVVGLAVEGHTNVPETERVENNINPVFSWVFSDPDANDSQELVEWEVLNRQTMSVVSATGPLSSKATTVFYDGPPLNAGTCYVLRLRVNDGADWSAWASLDFCIVRRASFLFSLYSTLLPMLVVSGLLSAVMVLAKPRLYRLADIVSVGIAALALLAILSEIIVSTQPFQAAPSLQLAFAAVLILIPVLLHFTGDADVGGPLDG